MGKKVILHSKPTLDKDDLNAVMAVLKSNHLEEGTDVIKLEDNFKHFFNISFASAVSSGFASIHLALKALDIVEGDEVIMPSYCCSAILNPVVLLGAIPIVVDIGKKSFNISVEEVNKKISSKTKAIIAPHIFGFPCKIDELQSLGIPIIEDCAQSLGGTYKGKKLGCFGTLSCFSFYSTKMICGGDGGLVATQNENLHKKIINYRYYGHKRLHKEIAFNYHLTNIPAALINSQLKKLNFFIERRKSIASLYDKYFSEVKDIEINFENKEDSIYYRYPVMLNKSFEIEKVKNEMLQRGIQCGYGVLDGLHELLGLDSNDFPNTSNNLKTILSLPIYPSLSDKDVQYIAVTLIDILKKKI